MAVDRALIALTACGGTNGKGVRRHPRPRRERWRPGRRWGPEGGHELRRRPAEPGEVPRGLAGRVTIEPSEAVNTDTQRVSELTTRQARHWINGMQWEGRTAAERETVALGTTEIWELVNLSPMAHPMHLHGRAFRVVDRSWVNASGEVMGEDLQRHR